VSTINKKEAFKGQIQPHTHLKTGDVGKYVLLPGDPARADIVARYLENSVLVTYNREYKTYTGTYKGIKVSVTSTGIGCPSASIAVEELANVGVENFIRIGTTAALQRGIKIGDLIISKGSMKNEGTSRFYVPDSFPAVPDLELSWAILETAKQLSKKMNFNVHLGINASEDNFFAETPEWLENLSKIGVMNIEMESSAIFTAAHMRGLRAASICAVGSNHIEGVSALLGDEKKKSLLNDGIEKMIKVALESVVLFEQYLNKNKGG